MRRFILLIVMAVFSLGAFAQERSVSGKVTSGDDGSGLPGVNVLLKGTSTGTVTDAGGNFTLGVPASGGTLVISFIGFATQELAIGERSVFDVTLASDVAQLSEVVVTGLGIAREMKTLPYASQTVSAERLNITRANNVNDAMAGKVAGVQVRGQSGAALGRNSTIRIRGAGSLSDKEPLYIVDGTPVTNSVDFNPDDIESTNVLKGPSATAIYGQRGDAGVIIVTTKKGKKSSGIGVDVSNSTYFDNVYVLPRYQNSYAGGSSADLIQFNHQPGMPAEWLPLDGKYYHDYTDDASWGPRMSGQDYIPWYAWAPGTKYSGQTAKLVGQPDNIRDFYETGVNSITNVSFGQAMETQRFRVSYTRQDQSGIMPNTNMKKNTVQVTTRFDLGKYVSIGANINYVNTHINGEFDDDYANQSSGSFNQWFHRNLDMKIMKELQGLKSPEGRLVSWNHFNPNYYVADSDNDGVINGDKFYRGYYWYNHVGYMNLIDYQTDRNRLFGDINMAFHITEKLDVALFYRKNQNTVSFENKRPSILPHSFYVENRPNSQPQYDYYGTGQSTFTEDNLELLVSYNTMLGADLRLDAWGGANVRLENSSNVNMNTVNGLTVPDLYTISNTKITPFGYSNTRTEKTVQSVYGRGELGWRETFFLNFTVRNDWSSALPASKNSYLYPSVGMSAVFSEYTEDALPWLSLGKFRASWAQVGSDLAAYQTALTYAVGANQWNGNATMATPNTLVDPNISPSLSSGFEVGMDLKFFKNRAGLIATYFTESKTNEILTVGVSGSSGFNNKIINAGQIDRNVIELTLEGTPIKAGDFSWDVMLNYASTTSKITALVPGIDAIPATVSSPSGSTGAVSGGGGTGTGTTFAIGQTYHVVGKEWGQLRGVSIQKIDGVPVVKADGMFVPTEAPVDFGSIMPNFTGGIINTFRYKDFSLTANIDFQSGGKFYSQSDQWGTYSGLTARTAELNDLGNPVRDNVADGGGVHVVGVLDDNADGVAEGTVDTYVPAQDYYHQFFNASIADPHIYDLTFVKLRELSITYAIPVKSIGSLGKVFTSASVSLIGRNLWLMSTNVQDFDPSEIASGFGENGQFPSVRSYGFNIRLSF